MSTTPPINFEIQVLTATGWEIECQYPLANYLVCLADARELFDSGHVEAVSIVKEVYDPAKRVAQEEVIYRSADNPKWQAQRRRRARPSKSRARTTSKTNKGRAKARAVATARATMNKRRTTRSTPIPSLDITKYGPSFIVVGLISLGGAAVLTYMAGAAIDYLRTTNLTIYASVADFLTKITFVVGFVTFFIPLMCRFGPSMHTVGRAKAKGTKGVVATDDFSKIIPPSFEPQPEFKEETETQEETPPPEPVDEVEDDPPVGHSEEDAVAAEDDVAAAEDDVAAAEEEVPAPEEEVESEDVPDLREEAARVSMEMLKFIGESLEPLASAGREMDAFNRFGLTLYFAGTGDYLASRAELTDDEMQVILCAHVQVLGHTRKMARRFCRNIDEYLVNPKYLKMYEAGRAEVVLRQQDPARGPGVVETMNNWNEPVSPGVKHDKEFVAVLFTDIVGSTAMTQERGDDAAQSVIHKHDAMAPTH